MADSSRFFSTARTFFLRYFLRTVNKNLRKSLFLAKMNFAGKLNGLAIFARKSLRKIWRPESFAP
ncbi:MAG TPA: hypothetical protein H9784_10525 [Candidatus Desulfovibrio intestinavium]|uniref:Uncharacterized protein n=1 Tax=Candidatus Desulfovibrio intestinavium TaxID=2838534 RepID=A0A9D2KRW4_9BACT|nr:hypothetical protein [Candidatus Desulfovibrio intestinavium]